MSCKFDNQISVGLTSHPSSAIKKTPSINDSKLLTTDKSDINKKTISHSKLTFHTNGF